MVSTSATGSRLISELFHLESRAFIAGKIAKVVERRDDGRITVRYDDGRLLMGREARTFERVVALGLNAKK